MRVLLDQGAPAPIRRFLPGHNVATAMEQGWSTLKNGELLQHAEQAGFEVLVTTDQNLKYQQNLAERRIAIVVLDTTSWPRIRASTDLVKAAIDTAIAGSYVEVAIL